MFSSHARKGWILSALDLPDARAVSTASESAFVNTPDYGQVVTALFFAVGLALLALAAIEKLGL